MLYKNSRAKLEFENGIVFYLQIPHAGNVWFLKTIYDGIKQLNCI
jgi:hypothetical protein